jgi:Gp5 N-terminal OB domain
MMRDTHFVGRDGFFIWYGVVEDRIDPDKLGRIKVRILGSHTKDKTLIPTQELHWCYVVQAITSAAMNGLGTSPLGCVPGTWVFGFYRDGEDMQEPVVLGTLGKIPQDPPDKTIGFNDPRDDEDATPETLETAPRKFKQREYPFDGSGATLTPEDQAVPYPRNVHPLGAVIKEPDTNRIARNENIDDTVIGLITQILDKKVPIAFGGTWDETDVWYDGDYPFVHVHESESGHIKVMDDTPFAEGSMTWDRTGTHHRVDTKGSEVHKIVYDGYTIVLRKNYIHIMNDQDERCDKEYNLSIGGRWNVEVAGNINIYSHSSIYVKADGDANIHAGGNINVQSGGTINVKAGGAIRIGAGAKISVSTPSSMEIKCGGNFAVDAADILLNCGAANPDPPDSATDPKQ